MSELTAKGLQVGHDVTHPQTMRSTLRSIDTLLRTTQTTVVLTDAQIKALPTTPVEIVAAPAAGLMIVPLAFSLVSSFGGGAYTNVDAGATMTPQFGSIAASAAVDVSDLTATGDDVVVPLDAKITGTVAGLQATALDLACANAALGNFTGGDAANTLTVTVVYATI